VIYLGSDVGDAWLHNPADLPIIVAGRGGGALRPGRLVEAGGQKHNEFLLALLHAMDVPASSFAGATRAFTGL
jgi:hypothetical protein